MNSINNKLLGKINPLVFSRYLKETAWTYFPRKRNDIKIFQNERDDEFFQITIPMDEKLNDYKEAMYTAINTLAIFENKPLDKILLHLLNPNADILKIRLEKKYIEDGNISLDDAISIYENAKKLLAATASDILHPRKYHQGRLDDSISNFLADCRFGQTEVGSYIVSVICPFIQINKNEEYEQLSIFSEEEKRANSLTRQVTNRIMSNLYRIKTHIDNDNIKELLNSTNNIISANFYEALIGLNLDSKDTNIEFQAEWSPSVKNNISIKNNILLTHDYYQPIESTINQLKDTTKKSTKIIGRIKKLESSPDVKNRTTGKVTIVFLNDKDKPKTVVAKLKKSDYDKAIKAHKDGSYVEIIGDISGNKLLNMACESFNIID